MKQYSHNIIAKFNDYESYFLQIIEDIKKYDRIAIFTHRTPDFDAFGSSFGFYYWLKENFKDKEIKILGENHINYTPMLFPYTDEVKDEWFEKDFLALVVDLGNGARCSDKRYIKSSKVIKIDHHPNLEPYGHLNFVDVGAVAVSEILTIMFLYFEDKGFVLPRDSAVSLFIGIVGDSGRFRYSSTTAATFAAAEALLEHGVDLSNDVYGIIYQGELEDLYIKRYILSNFNITKNGFAYYILDAETQIALKITPERGKENVNIFGGIRGIKVWAAITEDKKEGVYRVSIRSAGQPINEFAAKWNGGGHVQASGATIFKKEDIEVFVKEMNDYII